MKQKILLATTNKKKIIEMRPMLESLGYALVDLSEMPNHTDVEETGSTFLENARIKATTYAKRYETWAIGEDSGLCVPVLGGAPGVYSARYASMQGNTESTHSSAPPVTQDQANNQLLLENLSAVGLNKRDAYYVSTMVLASPQGRPTIESEGACWGRIVTSPRGLGGFGYDPLFEVVEYHRTFAELGASVKHVLSHRARALTKFMRLLRENPL